MPAAKRAGDGEETPVTGVVTTTSAANNRTGGSSREREKSPLPEWRLEQLRKAGRARGEQLKQDKAHQSRAGKALAAQRGPGYMEKIGSAGHTKALELHPDLQVTAGRAGLGRPHKKASAGASTKKVKPANQKEED